MNIKIGDYYYAPTPVGPQLVQVLGITEDDQVIARMQSEAGWIPLAPAPMYKTRVWEPAQSPGGEAA